MANEKKMNFVILGLLSHESLTGYEIKKRMDTTFKFFWSASYGSIYPTLNSLVQDGLVTKLDITENGRDKMLYTITAAGKELLKQWLVLPVTKDELRYETLMKVFFGGKIGPSLTLEHIHNFESKIKNDLPSLEGAVQKLTEIQDEEDDHKYFLLTATFGKQIYEAYLEWCEYAKKILGGTSSNQ
ncbi:PadR family transcriptional regulator [Neobacillus niacini]|uniref:PadR family transcriptional regulator n=1 Tax=Neobacillus niacini TaxID=86668 RepID=UPI0021CAF3AD|nr:PadR family transcriptional regulator [Neobacillus niacini]MCM3766230.1 PadR family transcriptional regulator [Neobacillus niacini]